MIIKNNILIGIAILGCLILLFLLGLNPGIGFTEDLGRHLLLGQIILDSGLIPKTNYLTYTHGDFPFINHHWLSEVQLHIVHDWLGYSGLIITKAFIGVVTLGFAMMALSPRNNIAVWWIIGIAAAILLGNRSHIRPEMFTFLCIGVFLWLFEKIREGKIWARWLCIATISYWANSHIYFIFGIGMLGALMLENISQNTNVWKKELTWFVLALAACCINPNGIDGLLYPLLIFDNHEIQTFDLRSVLYWWGKVINPAMMVLPIVSVVVVIALYKLWIPVGRDGAPWPRLANSIIAITALIASWLWIRSVPLLGLLSIPVVVEAWASNVNIKLNRKDDKPAINSFGMAAILFALLLNAVVIFSVVEGSYSRVFPTPLGPTPMGLDNFERYQKIRNLVQNHGLEGPVFSDFTIGSLVGYQIWPEKGYVDNRPEAFPADFWSTEYRPAMRFGDEWEQLMEQRKINVLFISIFGVPVKSYAKLMDDPEWVAIHFDSMMSIWLRNNQKNQKLINQYELNTQRINQIGQQISKNIDIAFTLPWWRRQFEVSQAAESLYGLFIFGGKERAWPHLKKIYQRYPDLQFIHNMMRLAAPKTEQGLIEDMMKKQSRWPFSARQIVNWGLYLHASDRTEEAIMELKRGSLFFPLSVELQKITIRLQSNQSS